MDGRSVKAIQNKKKVGGNGWSGNSWMGGRYRQNATYKKFILQPDFAETSDIRQNKPVFSHLSRRAAKGGGCV
jgi:hypothetical protein